MENRSIVYIALGSNVGDRLDFLTQARQKLEENSDSHILAVSKIYETEPWPKGQSSEGHPHAEKGQKWFLNQVLKMETMLSPQALMQLAEQIEKEIGRTKKEHWGPREIDIDILLYEDQVIDTPEFQIPHRHMLDRQFVLVPLLEINPDLTDPMTGRTLSDILKEIRKADTHKVIPFL